jgi:hypothetical protein
VYDAGSLVSNASGFKIKANVGVEGLNITNITMEWLTGTKCSVGDSRLQVPVNIFNASESL